MKEKLQKARDALSSIEDDFRDFPNPSECVRDLMQLRNGKALTIIDSILSELDSSWQPIEIAPKNGTEILGYMKPKKVELIWFFAASSATQNWLDTNGKIVNPTHWMPLPEQP